MGQVMTEAFPMTDTRAPSAPVPEALLFGPQQWMCTVLDTGIAVNSSPGLLTMLQQPLAKLQDVNPCNGYRQP